MIKKGFFPLQMFDFNKHMGFGIFLIDDLWNFLPVNKKKNTHINLVIRQTRRER